VAGTLTQIVPVASSSSGGSSSVATYAVTVTLTSPPDTVLAGMSATVTVTTAAVDNVLRVPATALQGSATAGYDVLVMNGSSTTAIPVTVGLVTSSYAEIQSGLTSGQTVVTGTITTRTGTTTTGGGVNVNSLTGGGGFSGGFGR
jgi:macrolide-specific efflux system membrane fusion protein